jgi:hypothetical protein
MEGGVGSTTVLTGDADLLFRYDLMVKLCPAAPPPAGALASIFPSHNHDCGGVRPIEQAAVIELTAAEIPELYCPPFDLKVAVLTKIRVAQRLLSIKRKYPLCMHFCNRYRFRQQPDHSMFAVHTEQPLPDGAAPQEKPRFADLSCTDWEWECSSNSGCSFPERSLHRGIGLACPKRANVHRTDFPPAK